MPGGQRVHALVASSVYEPGEQTWQVTERGSAAYEPAAHGVQTVAPGVLEKVPGGQSTQLDDPFIAAYVPAGHRVQTTAWSAAATRPASQASHTVAPASDW